MNSFYKYLLTALFLFAGLFFFNSCEKNITGSETQKTSVQFKLEKSDYNYYGKGWWRINLKGTIGTKGVIEIPKGILFKPNALYDEVKILALDMTKWKDLQEFFDAWEAAEQYNLFDTTLWSNTRDEWENISLTLKSYTGDYYQYVGEVNLNIEDSVARGSINLNPGLNYFMYAFRYQGKTVYSNESHSIIIENEKNVVRITAPKINSSPNLPGTPIPADGATNVSLQTVLSWQCSDPDGDTLSYNVYFGINPDPGYASFYQSPTTYNPGTLSPNTKYYWKIIAYDNVYEEAVGPIWSFTTGL
jgi:hypothetical protein